MAELQTEKLFESGRPSILDVNGVQVTSIADALDFRAALVGDLDDKHARCFEFRSQTIFAPFVGEIDGEPTEGLEGLDLAKLVGKSVMTKHAITEGFESYTEFKRAVHKIEDYENWGEVRDDPAHFVLVDGSPIFDLRNNKLRGTDGDPINSWTELAEHYGSDKMPIVAEFFETLGRAVGVNVLKMFGDSTPEHDLRVRFRCVNEPANSAAVASLMRDYLEGRGLEMPGLGIAF